MSLRAAYDLPDFTAALRFVQELGLEAEQMDHHPDLDVRWRTVLVRCSTHSEGGTTQLDVELAHRAQQWAKHLGGAVAPPATHVTLALDTTDPVAARAFWREALGMVEFTDSDGDVSLRDPRGVLTPLWFQPMDPPRSGRNRLHLDVYLPADEQLARLERLQQLGGRVVTDRHAPSWYVVADAEGNEVCLCRQDGE